MKYYLWVMFSAFGESNSIYRTCEFAFWEAELLLCNLVLGVVDKSVTFICWKIFSACVPFIETLIAKIRWSWNQIVEKLFSRVLEILRKQPLGNSLLGFPRFLLPFREKSEFSNNNPLREAIMKNNTITDGGSTAPLYCWYQTEEKTI